MYIPKRGYDDLTYNNVDYYPARALSERDQTLVDTAAAINYGSIDQGLGYFVTKCSDGNPCANDVHH